MTASTNNGNMTVLVDFPEPAGIQQVGLWPASHEELAARSAEALDRAMEVIAGMAERASQLKDQFPAAFTQAEIAFGVKLDYEAGALLARAGAEGSITVTLTWEREQKPMVALPGVS